MAEDKMYQLERTILELGAEMYRVRTEISALKDFHAHFVDVMKGLKTILDEKGLINADDFENAVDLGFAITMNAGNFDPSFEQELTKIKKTSH